MHPHHPASTRSGRQSFARRASLGAAVALVLALVVAPNGAADAAADGAVLPLTEAQVELGAAGYAGHCALCHGTRLEGMEHFPPLVGPIFQRRWADRTLGDLYTYVHDLMPLGAGGTLPVEEYAAIVAFMLERNGAPATDTPFDPENETHVALPLVLGEP
jgi:S-disulfanyl-L-cysteine oxidoreductase SoxD